MAVAAKLTDARIHPPFMELCSKKITAVPSGLDTGPGYGPGPIESGGSGGMDLEGLILDNLTLIPSMELD